MSLSLWFPPRRVVSKPLFRRETVAPPPKRVRLATTPSSPTSSVSSRSSSVSTRWTKTPSSTTRVATRKSRRTCFLCLRDLAGRSRVRPLRSPRVKRRRPDLTSSLLSLSPDSRETTSSNRPPTCRGSTKRVGPLLPLPVSRLRDRPFSRLSTSSSSLSSVLRASLSAFPFPASTRCPPVPSSPAVSNRVSSRRKSRPRPVSPVPLSSSTPPVSAPRSSPSKPTIVSSSRPLPVTTSVSASRVFLRVCSLRSERSCSRLPKRSEISSVRPKVSPSTSRSRSTLVSLRLDTPLWSSSVPPRLLAR
mmetsp:Transcript_31051/g.54528  ORF Transcript_31051/g.54528 Transcript_31051/m.54528 type:complete len:304 (-) Transcript_31051:562-1473(-)